MSNHGALKTPQLCYDFGVKEGQKILLYGKREFLVEYRPGKEIHTHLGKIILKEGLNYGDLLRSSTGAEFVVLKPSLADLMKDVRRKTTIIYPKDAGIMLLEAGVASGSFVGEAGTGSGALTLLLSRVVGREGKVVSFEVREEFIALALENLRQSPFRNYEIIKRDVIREGFGEFKFDALFIDLPEPWQAVPWAKKAIIPGGAWVSLSPNMEQMKKTVLTLREEGFLRIRSFEVLRREMVVRSFGVRPREVMHSHTGYITVARRGR